MTVVLMSDWAFIRQCMMRCWCCHYVPENTVTRVNMISYCNGSADSVNILYIAVENRLILIIFTNF